MLGKPAQRTSRKDVHRRGAQSSARLLKQKEEGLNDLHCSFQVYLPPSHYLFQARHSTARLVRASVEQQQAGTTEPCAGETSWTPPSSMHTAVDQLILQTMNQDSASSVLQGQGTERKKSCFFYISHQINTLFSRYVV